jgi:hypothetical protein
VLLDLILATFAALAVGVAPGWFWAGLLRAPTDQAERIALAVAFSMALVPAVALVPTRQFGLGITLPVAVGSALTVFAAGLAAHLKFGPAKGTEEPLLPSPAVPLPTPALVPLVAAFGLALGVIFGALPADAVVPAITGHTVPTRWMVLVIALLVSAAGVLHLVFSRRTTEPETVEPASLLPTVPPVVQRLLLPTILLLVLARGYVGPVLHDWPFMRGVDHYSHAVMANRMMEVGRIEPYLIYPPGFHTMTACVSRLTGLDPLEIFPVLGPALLLLPVLALYTLGTRLWGWGYGVAAGFFTVLLGGTYYYFSDAMYPNLVTSQFLLVMALASLVMVYRSPSVRSGLSLAVLGSSVVLYHPVASMYLAALLALVGLFFALPLVFRDRPRGVALTLSLALLGVLSVAYAWHTYDLGSEVSQLLGGPGGGATGEAMGMAVNTQAVYAEGFLIGTMVSQPVAWLGLLGVFLLVVKARDSFGTPAALAHLTVFFWAILIFAGSRLSVTGFPQRFGRDLGVPLALLAALGLIAVLKSLGPGRRPVAVFAASAVVLLSAGARRVRGGAEPPVGGGSEHPDDHHARHSGGGAVAGGTQRRRQHHGQPPRQPGAGPNDARDGRLLRAPVVRVRPDPTPQGPPPNRPRTPHGRPAHRHQPDLRTFIADPREVRRPLRGPLQEHARQAHRRLLEAFRGAPGSLPGSLREPRRPHSLHPCAVG